MRCIQNSALGSSVKDAPGDCSRRTLRPWRTAVAKGPNHANSPETAASPKTSHQEEQPTSRGREHVGESGCPNKGPPISRRACGNGAAREEEERWSELIVRSRSS